MLLKCPSSSSQIHQNGYSKPVIKDSTEENFEKKAKKQDKKGSLFPSWKKFQKTVL